LGLTIEVFFCPHTKAFYNREGSIFGDALRSAAHRNITSKTLRSALHDNERETLRSALHDNERETLRPAAQRETVQESPAVTVLRVPITPHYDRRDPDSVDRSYYRPASRNIAAILTALSRNGNAVVPGASVLNLGCGINPLELSPYGYRAVNIDKNIHGGSATWRFYGPSKGIGIAREDVDKIVIVDEDFIEAPDRFLMHLRSEQLLAENALPKVSVYYNMSTFFAMYGQDYMRVIVKDTTDPAQRKLLYRLFLQTAWANYVPPRGYLCVVEYMLPQAIGGIEPNGDFLSIVTSIARDHFIGLQRIHEIRDESSGVLVAVVFERDGISDDATNAAVASLAGNS